MLLDGGKTLVRAGVLHLHILLLPIIAEDSIINLHWRAQFEQLLHPNLCPLREVFLELVANVVARPRFQPMLGAILPIL